MFLNSTHHKASSLSSSTFLVFPHKMRETEYVALLCYHFTMFTTCSTSHDHKYMTGNMWIKLKRNTNTQINCNHRVREERLHTVQFNTLFDTCRVFGFCNNLSGNRRH